MIYGRRRECTAWAWFLCLSILVMGAEAAKHVSKKRRRAYGAEFGSFLAVIKYTFLLSILPIIVYFVYSVASDPDLPRILRFVWNGAKKRWLSYVGKRNLTVEPGSTEAGIDEGLSRVSVDLTKKYR